MQCVGKFPLVRCVMAKPTIAPVVPAEILTLVSEWQKASEWIKAAVKSEQELRAKLFAHFFPNPTEGTNNFLGAGIQVKGVRKVNRTLDKAALDSVMPQLSEQWRTLGEGCLIRYEPEFSLSVFKSMPDDQRKIFEQALSIKDGTPTLEITVAEIATTAQAAPAAKKTTTRKKK